MSSLRFTAIGRPVPQGSVRSLGKGRPSIHGNAATLLPWRDTITAAALAAVQSFGWERATTPVVVKASFYFYRPKSHFKADGSLRPNAPLYPGTRSQGDLEKLARGLNDALTSAGVFADDSQVAELLLTKQWVGPDPRTPDVPGVAVCVSLLPTTSNTHNSLTGQP